MTYRTIEEAIGSRIGELLDSLGRLHSDEERMAIVAELTAIYYAIER